MPPSRWLSAGNGALRVTVGVLLTIALAASSWALTRVVDHEGRVVRVETRQESNAQRFIEVKGELIRLNEKVDRLLERRGNP